MPTEPDIAASPTTPRVLLFGHPGSGKSMLLGALLQASDTQPEKLGVEITDSTGRLASIRDHIYAGATFANSRTELVPYLINLHPVEPVFPAPPPAPLLLLDCDGNAAATLMRHLEPLAERAVTGPVAAAVVQSDTIALVIDATIPDHELRGRFSDFINFLDEVHNRKSLNLEVGGFPIFLVLTKCDELAKEGDTKATWQAEVARRRQQVLKRFSEFLADDDAAEAGIQSPYLPFGSVTVEAFAVAIRWPELDDAPHPTDEPYGVAEFFTACFNAALAHRQRVRASDRRLKWTVATLLTTLWVLIAGVVMVIVFQPPAADPELPGRVRQYELRESPAAIRLAEKNIARHKKDLTAFRNDPGYFALPDDLQAFISGRLQEIEAYQAYREKLFQVPIPAEARTLEELDRAEAALTGELALPLQYSWGDTEAGLLRQKWLADVPLVRAAESAWSEWYRGLANRAVALTYSANVEGSWRRDVLALLADGERLPFDPTAAIPGSAAVDQPRGEPVTYRVPAEFDRVYQARRDWEFNRARLVHLRDLADLVGLTPNAEGVPNRTLELPEPSGNTDPATIPAPRLSELRDRFPRPSPDYPRITDDGPLYPEWELRNFPDPLRGTLTNRVRESFRNGTRQVKRLILARLGSPAADHAEGWRGVADSLGEPAFRDWGRLLRLLARLEDPAATDPVAELATFLKAREFPLDLRGFEIAIPLGLRVPALAPAGPFTITLTPRDGGPAVSRSFLPGAGVQEGLVMRFPLRPENDSKLTYHPGDGLKLEMPVKSGDQKFTLVWISGGTETFQFDKFAREPRLAPATGATEPATGVVLIPTGDTSIPKLPTLLPEVRR